MLQALATDRIHDLKMKKISPAIIPPLDPEFVPAALWNRAFLDFARSHSAARPVRIKLARPDGMAWTHDTLCLPDSSAFADINYRHIERLVKFLLWARGGNQISLSGAPEIAAQLARQYSAEGSRAFDFEFMGQKCFGATFQVIAADRIEAIEMAAAGNGQPLPPTPKGCRVGFDLGGSDRKCAAVIDGKVVYSEEIKWNPYFRTDPAYHREGIRDSIARAAAHLPRVDAIGGSAAGIYVNNEVRVGSLFRGINAGDFDRSVRRLFFELQEEWGGIPFTVANDGDVTALAGARSLGKTGVLGIAMGTSTAVGYVDTAGQITGALNELAFAPVDFRQDAPVDEWSKDAGCGVQYFSQQAVARLCPLAGFDFSAEIQVPERLEIIQEKAAAGDERALAIFDTIGVCFGYSLAHYADFYDYSHMILLGRVSSGTGGGRILQQARRVLDNEFDGLSQKVEFNEVDETTKRHGQAVAAAYLGG